MSLLGWVGEASASFPGRNGDIFLTQVDSNRIGVSGYATRVNPRSGRLRPRGLAVCLYQYYGFPPTRDPYCFWSGPAALSPDGRTAAVIGKGEWQPCPGDSEGCMSEVLRLLRVEGGETQVPLANPLGVGLARAGGYERVRWSPDGRYLLIDRPLGPQGGHAIYVAPVDDINRLSFVAEGSDADWSSDGRIVLVRRSNLHVGQIGTTFRRLTSRGGTQPSWSPHGRWIAFVRKGHLYKMPSAGGRPRRIVRRPGHSPTWSPDGKQIAFLRSNGEDYSSSGETRLELMYLVHVKTGRTRRIGVDMSGNAPDDGAFEASRFYAPDWQALTRVRTLRSR